MHEDRKNRLAAFADWAAGIIKGDEKSEAQIFLDRMFQAFGQKGILEVGGQPVTAPGVPPSYGDPTPQITDDRLKP